MVSFLKTLSASVYFGTLIPLVLSKNSVFTLNHIPFGLSKSVVYGLLIAIVPAVEIIFSPLAGKISDSMGRKVIILFGIITSLAGWMVMYISLIYGYIIIFIVGKVMISITAATSGVIFASIADYSHKSKRTIMFNFQFTAHSIAYISGAYFIDKFSDGANYKLVFLLLGIMYFLLTMMSLMWMKELYILPKVNLRKQVKFKIKDIFNVLKHEKLKQIFIVWLVFEIGFILFYNYSGEFLYSYRGLSNNNINYFFAFIGFAVLASQTILVPILSKFIKSENILPFSMLAIGSSLFIMGILKVGVMFYIVAVLYCLGVSIFLPNMKSYFANLVNNHEKGRAMSILVWGSGLSSVCVTVAGSFIVAKYLPTPFIIGGSLILVSSLLCFRANKKASNLL